MLMYDLSSNEAWQIQSSPDSFSLYNKIIYIKKAVRLTGSTLLRKKNCNDPIWPAGGSKEFWVNLTVRSKI